VSPTHESPGIEAYAVRGYPRNRLTERPADEVVVTKTTQSRGFKISYDDAGQGPVIVLIPGLTMSAADWRDAGYVDQLAVSHRVLSVDPLGNGVSDKPHDPGAYAYPAVAADVVAVMDAAGVDRATVWGYSRGAALALALGLAAVGVQIWQLVSLSFWPGQAGFASVFTGFYPVFLVVALAVLIWLEILIMRCRVMPAIWFVEQPPTYAEAFAVQRFQAALSAFTVVWNYLAVVAVVAWVLFYLLH